MPAEEDILMLLRRTSFVRDVVGKNISQDSRPQSGTEPAIVLKRQSGGFEHELTGQAHWSRPQIEITCYAPKATDANNLRDRVRHCMQGFSGVVGETHIGGITLDDEQHGYIYGVAAGDTGTFMRALMFTVIIVPAKDLGLAHDWFTLSLVQWETMGLDDWTPMLL